MKRERTKQPLLNRILAWSTPEPNSGCWLWLGTLTQYGYGEIFAHGKKHLAHRIAYQEIVGPIPPELCCDHLCRVRSCVNPSHIDLVTLAENNRRGIAGKVRIERAKKQTHCKWGHALTSDNVVICQGARHCRECNRRRCREYLKRKARIVLDGQ